MITLWGPPPPQSKSAPESERGTSGAGIHWVTSHLGNLLLLILLGNFVECVSVVCRVRMCCGRSRLQAKVVDHACCRAASVVPPWNSRCKIELIFGVMLQFNVVWCIRSRREIVLTIQSDNGRQGYKVGGKKYCRPKVVLSRQPWRPIWQRLDSETRGILSSQRGGRQGD